MNVDRASEVNVAVYDGRITQLRLRRATLFVTEPDIPENGAPVYGPAVNLKIMAASSFVEHGIVRSIPKGESCIREAADA
jgi:hypothetical protein